MAVRPRVYKPLSSNIAYRLGIANAVCLLADKKVEVGGWMPPLRAAFGHHWGLGCNRLGFLGGC